MNIELILPSFNLGLRVIIVVSPVLFYFGLVIYSLVAGTSGRT